MGIGRKYVYIHVRRGSYPVSQRKFGQDSVDVKLARSKLAQLVLEPFTHKDTHTVGIATTRAT